VAEKRGRVRAIDAVVPATGRDRVDPGEDAVTDIRQRTASRLASMPYLPAWRTVLATSAA